MAKYSFEFKKKVVQTYLNGEGGAKYLSNKFQIHAKQNVETWVKSYLTINNKVFLRELNKCCT